MLRVLDRAVVGTAAGHGPGRGKKIDAFHLYPQMNQVVSQDGRGNSFDVFSNGSSLLVQRAVRRKTLCLEIVTPMFLIALTWVPSIPG
jgi:hypothetical protein